MTKKIGVIVFALFYLSVFFLYQRGKAQKKAFHFSGVIEKIRYDVKMIPYLTVHGETYYLSPLGDFDKKVKVGDSVIKLSGEFKMKVIKQDHTVIEFKL